MSWFMTLLLLFLDFSECTAGGGRDWHEEEVETSAELPEVLSRLQVAKGSGFTQSRVAAPPGR